MRRSLTLTILALLLPLAAMAEGTKYIITGNGSQATASPSIEGATGAIQNVINAIRGQCAAACEIQFGDGEIEFNIATSNVTFANVEGSAWGDVIISGKIVGSSQAYTIIVNGPNVTSTVDIRKISDSNNAINNSGSGTLTINGGTISAFNNLVVNSSSGIVNITSGTISASYNQAVNNASTGTMNISGGTISAPDGYSVVNVSTGTINISGGTMGRMVRNYDSNGRIILGGSPIITGQIYALSAANISSFSKG